ncbi:MAG: Asp-tRNA(Asn)/Glu-tRNA(Gln) amidotransferase subunit GatA [Sulfuritalea sp.]|nr:Asp-tRNA(Asn)/Glu-tRNA(Gln) amidotransferase subunit GatA [Sulfuritalea sp.]MDP1981820.1 Asp-tRNA(Asn)/Glu-tRNA(Gln) amidotransferase subunit GatA [Sulfuritalea sp.]
MTEWETDATGASLRELSAALLQKKISSVELTTHYLDRIERLNPALNAFITVDREKSLAEAKQADERISVGSAGPLTGIPLAHKDIFCAEGWPTTCGSKMLANFVSPYDAHVITRCKEAGMVSLGKTNMDEFAMGSSNENSWFGPAKNPWDVSRVPGGSSGGSAASVAAGMAPIATGTDTGGSIRQPASFCGVTGIKPTYGRVSRYGMIAYASSLDQGGVIARSAEDAALVLQAMSGFDPRDSTCVDRLVPDFAAGLDAPIDGRRIGVPREWMDEGLDAGVGQVVTDALREFEKMGAKIVDISLPRNPLCVPAYYVIAMCEASSNLARFDGVRYGRRCEDPRDLTDLYMRSRAEGFGAEVKRRILIGTYALSHGYYDAYYLQAQKLRRLISEDYQQAFENVDVIMGPVAPTPAFRLGENMDDQVKMYLADIYTLSLNLAGLPGMSIPAGFAGGLPVGLQIIGNYWQEGTLLSAAHQFQQATEWHSQSPAGTD